MKQTRNSIMRGTSGALGDELVFRQRAGKTVISLPPIVKAYPPTTGQLEVRNKFLEACRYAKTVLANPALKEAYAAKSPAGTSAYNTATADFFRAPVILSVDTGNYNGSAGGTILVLATDDFKVQSVRVSVIDADGEILEEGLAVAGASGTDLWTYTALNSVDITGAKVSVQAHDLPGNVTTQETEL
ncbi:hypothetical protein [Chitinophaga cymbidii]|uniref:Uncharacterized protein n=1 Tax=Chitinophaga cymbidii TaxID=1096750 RepID=A0A512RGZ2_9BACT|nr:hypothetical protein [Chitinophaga cymbidii]GEP94969.1 hypothetical protein CCY01nite_12290 [Chitinophaga cymbidii]